jgi:hypothetical protein
MATLRTGSRWRTASSTPRMCSSGGSRAESWPASQHLVGGAADRGDGRVDDLGRGARLADQHRPVLRGRLHQRFQRRVVGLAHVQPCFSAPAVERLLATGEHDLAVQHPLGGQQLVAEVPHRFRDVHYPRPAHPPLGRAGSGRNPRPPGLGAVTGQRPRRATGSPGKNAGPAARTSAWQTPGGPGYNGWRLARRGLGRRLCHGVAQGESEIRVHG